MEQLELKLLWEVYHGLKKVIIVQNRKLDNFGMVIRGNSFYNKDEQFSPNQLLILKEASIVKDIINPESVDFEKAKDLLENLELILIKYGGAKK